MKKTWVQVKSDPQKIRDIAQAFNISPVLAALIFNRGIETSREIRRFLNPHLSCLHNPFLLPDMEKAVVRLRRALDEKEKILIYGDSDVDGVTSIAILVRTLKSLGAAAEWVIPGAEGYGLHKSLLERQKSAGASLVVTVDTGTSAVQEIAYANEIGLDVIVTDHHSPPEILPNAYAIVNPNLKHSTYPFKSLAGCVTAFKLAQGLMFSFNRSFNQDYVVLDIETTSLSPLHGTVVEIAAVHIRNFAPIEQFHTLIDPERPIPPGATDIHGITDEMVQGAPTLETVLPKFLSFLGDKTIVAHNASFDVGFLKAFTQKILGEDIQNPVIDTLGLARGQFQCESHSLTHLVEELGIEREVAHRALHDCLATASLFERIELARDPRLGFFLEDELDLVTLGTIADVVPLLGENRIIVKEGIPRLLKTRKVGLKELLNSCGISTGDLAQNPPTAKDLSWTVTPLLNAAGRFDKAELTARLLLTESEDEARDLVGQISRLNLNRRSLQKLNLEKFLELAEEQCNPAEDKILFVAAEGLSLGVTGIVASHLAREYSRPAFLLISENGTAIGSSRSVPGFNVLEALRSCEDLLVKYGGHPMAAGLTVASGNIPALKSRLLEFAAKSAALTDLGPRIEIEHELAFSELTKSLIQELAKLEPFGQGNPVPVFVLKEACLKGITHVGAQKNHLKLMLGDSEKSLAAVGWSMAHRAAELALGKNHDFVFHLEMDRWNGREALQLVLLDLAASQEAATAPGPVQLDLMIG